MQNALSIIRQPILLGLLLSIAVHGAMLHSRAIYTPPIPHMATGRTAVQLTLLPSPAGSAAASSPRESALPSATKQSDAPAQETEPLTDTTGSETATPHVQTEEHKGITSSAVTKGLFHPTYPRVSRQRGEEGTVTLQVQVLANGTAGNIVVVQSSGHRRLNDAAVKAAGRTEYEAALLLGQPVESTMELSYTYRLEND